MPSSLAGIAQLVEHTFASLGCEFEFVSAPIETASVNLPGLFSLDLLKKRHNHAGGRVGHAADCNTR